jgi:putative MATE family efflux protein
VSLVIGGIGAYFAPQLLGLMGASSGVIEHRAFTQVMLGGCASVVMLFLINSVLRSSGDAATAMRVLWLANGINIILGPTLVFGWGPFPEMGIVGAAIATTIGRGTGALFAFTRLLKPASRVRVRKPHFHFDPALIVRVVNLSSAATFQVFIGMASWIGLVRIIAEFGSNALAGWTIGIRVIGFALLPSFGMANAAATMVGQSLGAKKPDRAEAAVWTAGKYNAVFLGIVGLLFVIFTPQVVRIFTPDPEVARYAIASLRTIACGFLFYAYGMVLTQAFNGAGDTRTPTWINLGIFWLLEIPLAWVLANTFGMGPMGAFLAATIAFCLLAVVSAILFRRGGWRTRAV